MLKLREVGPFAHFMVAPLGYPSDGNDYNDFEHSIFMSSFCWNALRNRLCGGFRRVKKDAIGGPLGDLLRFTTIGKLQRSAASGNSKFFRADQGDLRDRGSIGSRANEGIICKDFHGSGLGGGKNQGARAKLCLGSFREAMQRDAAQARQVQRSSGTSKLKRPLRLCREEVTVVDGCAGRYGSCVEVCAGRLCDYT